MHFWSEPQSTRIVGASVGQTQSGLILEIIKESNFEIPLFLLENFFLKAVEKENNNFVNKLVKSNDYDVTSQEINDEMTTLITMQISIIIDKCYEC